MHLDYLNKTADLSRPDDISSNKIVTMTSTGSEEELYFEMEFNSKTEDEISISSKSVETLSNSSQSQVSQISHENSQDLFQDQRRGSSVGPILERPKYLRLVVIIVKQNQRTLRFLCNLLPMTLNLLLIAILHNSLPFYRHNILCSA